jgi:UTP--glucose-1-phosphate uridylyltransferase
MPCLTPPPPLRPAQEYRRRLPTIPNIRALEHLTVSGDVVFGRNVTLKGTVIIVANEGSCIHLPDGSVLEDKVVTGNLSIFDH